MNIQGKGPVSGSVQKPSGRVNSGVPAQMVPEGCEVPRDIDELQECFIRAHGLERREPGGGRWPFAGDGPWHLMQGQAGDYAGDGQDGASSSVEPRTPLSAAEVAELRLLRQWLLLVPERDRKLVWIATGRLHAGEGHAPWKAIGQWLKIDRSADTIARRYREGLATVVCELNWWPKRWVKRMAG